MRYARHCNDSDAEGFSQARLRNFLVCGRYATTFLFSASIGVFSIYVHAIFRTIRVCPFASLIRSWSGAPFTCLALDQPSSHYGHAQEDGFLMNVDTKWRTHPNMSLVPRGEWYAHPSVTDLYCLVISHRRGIRTIRDLRATHIPMLKEIYW